MKDDLIGICELCNKGTARVTKHGEGSAKEVHLCLACNTKLVKRQMPYAEIVALVEAARQATRGKTK